MSFEQTPVRRALDYLLDAYPIFDLVSIDWQTEEVDLGRGRMSIRHAGPWVLIELGQPSETFERVPAWALWRFAIWKTTGALHTMRDGAVSDDPVWTP